VEREFYPSTVACDRGQVQTQQAKVIMADSQALPFAHGLNSIL